MNLHETIREVVTDNEDALALDALIRSRFYLVEKVDPQTGDGLPVLVSIKIGKDRYAFNVGGSKEIE